MTKNKNDLEGKEVALKFPPPKSSIAAIPAHEVWHGRLEIVDSKVAAAFKPSGLDAYIKIILSDEQVTFLMGGSGELRAICSPDDVKNGVHPFG